MSQEFKDMHMLMGMLDSIDVGVVVLDRNFDILVWNHFMSSHSGMRGEHVVKKNIFDLFPELPDKWLKNKAKSVHMLRNRAFTTWEQRPYLFKFKNYRPITGAAEYMYQNITFFPVASMDGKVHQIGMIIYDVTDMAVNKIELEAANDELAMLSRTDRLTLLNNRGHWEECLVNEFMRVKRTKQATSLIMFDIDHFKNVNDTYGHQAGDEVIRRTSATLRRTIRKTDIAGRYGGEEFCVILVDTNAENSLKLAERLRKAIERMTVKHDTHEIKFTISIGISELSEKTADHAAWLEESDKALYFCKENGRNQSKIFSPDMDNAAGEQASETPSTTEAPSPEEPAK